MHSQFMPTPTKKTKYRRIAEILQARMTSGELQVGDRLPSFAQMYREHGASVATMSRAYELLESQSLIERRSGSGVYVAEPKRPRDSGKLGLFLDVRTLSNPYAADLMMGIHNEAARHGLEILMLNVEDNVVEAGKVDAIVLHCSPSVASHLQLPPQLPHVLLFHYSPDFTTIVPDDCEGAKLATRHLLDLGHRHIACLLHSDYNSISLQRLAGYRAAHQEAGIAVDEKQIRFLHKNPFQSCREAGELAMTSWLKEDWSRRGYSALVAQNDATAIGAMKVLRSAGLRIPEDVSIVGFDGTEISEFCNPHLTTIKVPLEDIGAKAVKVLAVQIRDGIGAVERIVLPVQLKGGDSVVARRLERAEKKELSYA